MQGGLSGTETPGVQQGGRPGAGGTVGLDKQNQQMSPPESVPAVTSKAVLFGLLED